MRVDPAVAMMAEEVTTRAEETSEAGADGFANVFDALVGERSEEDAEAGRGDESVPTRQEAEADPEQDARPSARLLLDGSLLGGDAQRSPDASARLALAPPTLPVDTPHSRGTAAATVTATAVAESQGNAPVDARSVAPAPDPTSLLASAGAEAVPDESADDPALRLQAAAASKAERLEALPAERPVSPVPDPAPRPVQTAADAPVDATRGSLGAQTLAVAGALSARSDTAGLPRDEARTRSADTRPDPRAVRDARADAPRELLESAAEADPEAAEELTRTATASADRATLANAPAPGAAGAPPSPIAPAASFAPGSVVDVAGGTAPTGPDAPLPPQTVQALPQQVQIMAAEGGGTARMRLSPPELGELQIRVSLRGTAVDVVIKAEEPAAQLAVMTQREQLADALGARELRMDGFDVLSGERGASERDLPGQRWPDQNPFGDEAGNQAGKEGDASRVPGHAAEADGGPGSVPAPATPTLHAARGGVDLRV